MLKSGGSILDANPGSDLDAIQHSGLAVGDFIIDIGVVLSIIGHMNDRNGRMYDFSQIRRCCVSRKNSAP